MHIFVSPQGSTQHADSWNG